MLIIVEMKKISFRYSKISSSLFTISLLGIFAMSIPNLIKFINQNDTTSWLLFLLFDLCFLLIAVYIIVKQLIPALQDKIAFEIDETGITSYVKNVVIKWEDIEKIEMKSGKTSSVLYVTYKCDTDRARHLRIALAFVEGDDAEIYNEVMAYFEKSKVA